MTCRLSLPVQHQSERIQTSGETLVMHRAKNKVKLEASMSLTDETTKKGIRPLWINLLEPDANA